MHGFYESETKILVMSTRKLKKKSACRILWYLISNLSLTFDIIVVVVSSFLAFSVTILGMAASKLFEQKEDFYIICSGTPIISHIQYAGYCMRLDEISWWQPIKKTEQKSIEQKVYTIEMFVIFIPGKNLNEKSYFWTAQCSIDFFDVNFL